MGAQVREILFLFANEEQDQAFYQQLKTHLQPLLENEQYTCWSHLDVSPGRATAEQLHQHLISAPIIVVLLSPEYLASEQSDIVDIAIHRHQT